ncbi:MAG TPA: hypothetical protein VJP58_08605 [Candidatus Nitrosocosmicus sp.]|nr:hypothetical protein [Candidatus Nitrosocosmicus sp.]
MLSNLQFQLARQIPLYSFDGKNYRMEMKWAKEKVPVAVAYTANVELTVVSPIKAALKSSEANAIPQIKELENLLEVDNLTENKNLDSDLGPALFFLMQESRGIGS